MTFNQRGSHEWWVQHLYCYHADKQVILFMYKTTPVLHNVIFKVVSLINCISNKKSQTLFILCWRENVVNICQTK